MSEYQYYEFAAIDRRLTHAEMAELRAVSTRAVITPAGFTNHYEWGDLKADPADWMRRYFDAFVYSANWCSCQLSLRVPRGAFRKADLEPFANRHALSIEASESHWIFDWMLDESEHFDRFAMDDGSGWMRRLLPLRDDLLRGDLRPLYLGWLAGASTLRGQALEPVVPPGLEELSPGQQALVEFLEVDPDLLTAVRTRSAKSLSQGDDDAQRIDAWLDTLSNSEMKDALRRLAQGHGQEVERQIKSRYAAWSKTRQSPPSPASPRRRVATLRELTRTVAAIGHELEALNRAKQEARRRRQREAELRRLMAQADKHWKTADAHARRGDASGYKQAVRLISDLAEAHALISSREAFDRELQHFLIPHSRRTALLRRLADERLWLG